MAFASTDKNSYKLYRLICYNIDVIEKFIFT